jgi:hypothetical protein
MKTAHRFLMTLPFLFLGSLSAHGAGIVYTYGANVDAQKQTALQAAAAEVEQIIRFDHDVKVTVSFASLTCNATSAVLGQAGPDSAMRDFSGAPQSATWYVYAEAADLGYAPAMSLANHITGQFNNDIGTTNCLAAAHWFFGTDHNPPANDIDFVSVIKHELMHGLGFLSFIGSDGQLASGYMDNYSSFLYDNSTGKSWKNMTSTERASSMLNNNNLVWDGSKGKAMVGLLQAGITNGRARLYAPASYQSGSSVSHFDTSLKYVTGADELMEPVYNSWMQFGISAAAFCDMGWGITLDTDGDGKNDCADASPMSRQIARNDFGGNNKSDVLFLNTGTGATRYWSDAVKSQSIYVGTYNLNYTYAGSGDFDGDGKADLLFTQASSNATLIWSGAVKTAAIYPDTSTAGFNVAAICDTNGDSKDDVVWFNPTTGVTQIWSGAVKASITYPGTQTADFMVAACADFDGDGKADIFWHNTTSGVNQIWLSANRSTKVYPGTSGDLTWASFGAGDIDGDGKADLVWYNASTNGTMVWKAGLKSSLSYPGTGTSGFTPKAIGDYNGDGKADLFWANDTTLATQIWPGVVKSAMTYPGTYPAGFAPQK